MSSSSFKDRLIEAAREQQQVSQQKQVQLPKKIGCPILIGFFALFLIVAFFIGKSFFMDFKGFDMEALNYASDAQVEMISASLKPGYSIQNDHCIIRRVEGDLLAEHGEAYIFGSRIMQEQEELGVLYCLLSGPRIQPAGAALMYEKDTLFSVLEPHFTSSQLRSKPYLLQYQFSGRQDIQRYYGNSFDKPDEREKGLLWSIYGLGKKAKVEK